MAVSEATNVSAGKFTPFRTASRGGDGGGDPVATLHVDAQVTGDGSGGEASINIRMQETEFGFRPIWVTTLITSRDDLAAAEEVTFFFASAGNERLQGNMQQVELAVRSGSTNVATFDRNLMIDPDQGVVTQVIGATWPTNTNAKVYHLHVFGFLFDSELVARSGRLSDLLGGLT